MGLNVADIRIGSKVYKKVEKLPKAKIEHMIQLLDIEIVNYKNHIKNYPPERMEKFGIPFLNTMENDKKVLEGLISDK